MIKTNQRQIWVDNVKVIAIALVAIGHLYQSLVLSNVLENGSFFKGFNSLIYCFHVPLFFICSGFLYQHLTKEQNFKSYSKNILKKLVSFGIPYFVFSTVTYALKFIFSSTVNNQNEGSYLNTLLVRPAAPYWFLYALFFLFLVSPVLKSKADGIIRIAVGVGLYFLSQLVSFDFLPDIINLILYYICQNLIWFVFGMAISYFDITKYYKKQGVIFFLIFLILGILFIKYQINFTGQAFILGIIACVGIIFFIGSCYNNNKQTKIFGFLSKYTTPIFLMHTIFAAGTRSILFKIGITNACVHIIAGIIASFVFPIIAAMIMEKIKLDILYNPTKYIKIK